jgi:hypothetical protein
MTKKVKKMTFFFANTPNKKKVGATSVVESNNEVHNGARAIQDTKKKFFGAIFKN